MEVEMTNGLAAFHAAVSNDAIALFQIQLFGELCNGGIDLAYNCHILFVDGIGAGNMGFRDHKKMYGSLRLDIVECNNSFLYKRYSWNIFFVRCTTFRL